MPQISDSITNIKKVQGKMTKEVEYSRPQVPYSLDHTAISAVAKSSLSTITNRPEY
jgi:hypothetical protein